MNDEHQIKFPMLAKTIAGLESVLADELTALGAEQVEIKNRGVAFTGTTKTMYAANLWCRTALRILKPIATFPVGNEDQLYARIKGIRWDRYMRVDDTLAVDAVVNYSTITHSKYASLKAKDAIVDQFREKFDKRPSVDTINPSLRINIYLSNNECTVSIDSSGGSLHRRGYRKDAGEAPISEVLAAGMVLLSGWKKDCHFIDPMCGSATLLIEAALIAYNIPPGYYRKEFGFEHWLDFNQDIWDEVLDEAAELSTDFDYRIIGSDMNRYVIGSALENIKFAKLHKDIELKVAPIHEATTPEGRCFMVINPPYGERVPTDDIIGLYKQIGDFMKKNLIGGEGWVISSDHEAIKHIGLRPTRRLTLYNGQLECKFFRFDIYAGSKKDMYVD